MENQPPLTAQPPTPRLNDEAWRPPQVETPRLVLRGWELSDVQQVYDYASDPEVAAFMAWERHTSSEHSLSFLNGFVAQAYSNRELSYALCLRSAPERALGGIGVHWRSRGHKVLELGYVLSRSHWGQGYMPEAGRELIAFAFRTTPVERIYAPIFGANAKSRRAAEKMGMTFEGVLRSALELRGQRWDEAIYSVLRSEVA